MYSRNIQSLLGLLVDDGGLELDFDDEIVRETCVTHGGRADARGGGRMSRTVCLCQPMPVPRAPLSVAGGGHSTGAGRKAGCRERRAGGGGARLRRAGAAAGEGSV